MAAASLIVIDDIIEITVHGVVGASPWTNVLHFRCAAPMAGDSCLLQLQVMAGLFDDFFLDTFKNSLTTQHKIIGATFKRVFPTPSPVYRTGYAIDGVLATQPGPTSVAIHFRKNSDQAGRKGVGHFYLAAPDETFYDGDFVDVSAGLLIALAVLLTETWTIEASGEFRPVIVGPDDETGDFTDVVVVTVSPRISTQDRRKPAGT